MAGCSKPFQHPYALEQVPPPDLAIEVSIRSPWNGEADALTTPSQYIVQPDRRMHAAIGPGAGPHYFPPPTATLSHAQFALLWQIIEQHNLMTTSGLDAAQVDAIKQNIKADTTVSQEALEAQSGVTVGTVAGQAELADDRAFADEFVTVNRALREGMDDAEAQIPTLQGRPLAPGITEIPADAAYLPEPGVDGEPARAANEQAEINQAQADEAALSADEQLPVMIELGGDVISSVGDPGELPRQHGLTVYEVHINAYGDHVRYATTPSGSPGTVALVQQMAKLRGWVPVFVPGETGTTREVAVEGDVELMGQVNPVLPLDNE